MIDLFPNGREIRGQVRSRLASEFELTRRVFAFALSISDNPIRAKNLPLITANMAWGLHVKACKQFRAIAILVEAGCAGEGETIGRALLESLLVLNFVLRPRFTYKWRHGRPIRRETIPRRKRAMMAVVHGQLQVDRAASLARRTPGLKRAFRNTRPPDVTAQEKILGPDVVNRLKKSTTCAGLSIADLALNLGGKCQRLHAMLYGDQSRRAHPSDITEHIDISEISAPTGVWHSTLDDLRWALQIGMFLLLACLESETNYFKFDLAVRDQLATLANELKELRQTGGSPS